MRVTADGIELWWRSGPSNDGVTTARATIGDITIDVRVGPDEEGRLSLVSIVVPADGQGVPKGGITAQWWRSVPVGRLTELAIEAHHGMVDAYDESGDYFELQELFHERTGRIRRPDRAYAVLARAYERMWLLGDRSASSRLAQSLGWPQQTLNTRLADARQRGLLLPQSQAVNGQLTTALARQLAAEPSAGAQDDGNG